MKPLAASAVLAGLLLSQPVVALAEYPPPQKPIADFAGVLGDSATASLRAQIAAVERDTTAEIAVVTVRSLEGQTVEQYANGLFHEWGIGKKGANNGVLVLVATGDRKVRVEVGYGLEPILPDGLAGAIIRTSMTPRFKEGNYAGGIADGVERIAATVRAKHVLTPEERQQLEEGDRPSVWLMTPFFGLFIAIGAFAVGAGFRSKAIFPIVFGWVFGGVPLLMSMFPFFNAFRWVTGLLAVGMGVWGWVKGAAPSVAAMMRGSSSSSSYGDDSGWVMGSSSSSSDSSSSSSGSFGGGDSGGGGASGSW